MENLNYRRANRVYLKANALFNKITLFDFLLNPFYCTKVVHDYFLYLSYKIYICFFTKNSNATTHTTHSNFSY